MYALTSSEESLTMFLLLLRLLLPPAPPFIFIADYADTFTLSLPVSFRRERMAERRLKLRVLLFTSWY